MKLVLTKKPILEGGEQIEDVKAGAAEGAEDAELDSLKGEMSTGAFDISVAFLNAVLEPGDGCLDSGHGKERERSERLDNAMIAKAPGDSYGDLHLKLHSLVLGLWSFYDGSEIVGMTTMFVDDGLTIGPPEVVMRVMEYVRKIWKPLKTIIEKLEGAQYEIRMLVDNLSSVTLLNKPTWNHLGWRTRHFAIRASWIRDQLRDERGDTHKLRRELGFTAAARICREPGATVALNVRRIEGIANGLALWGRSAEAVTFLRLFARCRARSAPPPLQSACVSAYVLRWSALLACAAARAFASSLLSLPLSGAANVDGDPPLLSDLLAEPSEGESNLLDLDSVSLNTLAGILDWRFSIACVSRMRYLGLVPDAVSWTSATAAAARSRGWCRATTIATAGAQHIEAKTGSAPYAAASIPGFVRHGRWEDAVLIADEMCREGDDVSDAVVNGAISACADARRWNAALGLATRSTSRQLQPSLITVNTVLSSCGGSSVWDGAVGWLHMARCTATLSTSWDVFTYSAWISSYTAAALWQAALRTLALARHAAAVSVASQTAGLAALGCARQWRRMLGLLAASEMQPAASMAPECVNAALQGCFDSRRWPVSLDLLTVSQMLRIDIDQTGLACLIRTCGGALLWVAAMDLLEAGGPWPPAAGDQTWNANCWADESASTPVQLPRDWPILAGGQR
ncbi:EMB2076 [Symbiodinium sp. CCMP2592]|nr:EMB2076 [Symbiodinium sp. CCMP2592]